MRLPASRLARWLPAIAIVAAGFVAAAFVAPAHGAPAHGAPEPTATARAKRDDPARLAPFFRTTTHVYKRVGELEIKANLHRSNDETVRPVVVWIHGGGLIYGRRESMPQPAKMGLLNAGYAIFSIDYRLAPETKLPEIVRDVEDALAWLRANGSELHVRTDRIAVMGSAAGAYLALTTGYRVKPPPTAIVSLWGSGDLLGDWYNTPSSDPRHNFLHPSKEDAWKEVSGAPVANVADRKGNGLVFNQYCRQHGVCLAAISGWDPESDADALVPFMPARNVSADFPPTLLIHGARDTDVPIEQSHRMASALGEHGVPRQVIAIDGGHALEGADRKEIAGAYASVVKFLDSYMKP